MFVPMTSTLEVGLHALLPFLSMLNINNTGSAMAWQEQSDDTRLWGLDPEGGTKFIVAGSMFITIPRLR